ncbi:MAG: hypothetical protein RMJ98_21925, partial [Myxococcales bacterium]|nr:hypothetical protein [Myxococcales bacterium]
MQRKLLPRLLEGAFRLLGAGLLGAIGVLFLWVTWQVLLHPLWKNTLVGWLALKGFALLVMGGIGVGLLLCGLGVLFPELPRLLEPSIPLCLRDLCPGCGVQGGVCSCGFLHDV